MKRDKRETARENTGRTMQNKRLLLPKELNKEEEEDDQTAVEGESLFSCVSLHTCNPGNPTIRQDIWQLCSNVCIDVLLNIFHLQMHFFFILTEYCKRRFQLFQTFKMF